MTETPVVSGAVESSAVRYVAPLEAFGAGDLERAGGKGANLGALVRSGRRVPGGFVVTTDAYAAVVEASGLAPRIEAHLAAGGGSGEFDAAAAGAAIRAEFTEIELPDDLSAAITEAYGALGGGPVAVRSSATAEDLPGAAFAGQQDTYLNVVGAPAVLGAVRDCWASLWTDRAIAYRRRLGIDSAEVRIAVVVQAMVEAEAAGVMFTANPVTGARGEIVVDASAGLGEAVVSGMVTPDHYVLDRRGRVREYRQGRREVVIRAVAGGGTVEEAGDAAGAERLPGEVLAELAELGTAVAGHFGRPQDMEWAYARGLVWLLQARPLTALPPPPVKLNRVQRFIGPTLLEMFTVRPYPLDMSAWIMPGPGRMVQRMMAEMPGLRVDFAAMLPEVDGVVDRFVPPTPRPTWRTLTAPARLLPRIRRYDPADWRDDPRLAEFERRIRELSAIDLRGIGWTELARIPRQALAAVDIGTALRIDYLPRTGVSLARLRLALRRLGLSGEFPTLILGAKTRTADCNRALEALARRVREDPELLSAFAESAPEELAERIRRGEEFVGFRAALEEFQAEYGHRETASALLMSAPTWGDSPATVLGAVKSLAGGQPGSQEADPPERSLERVLAHPKIRGREQASRRIRRLVEAARAGVAFREDTHFDFTRALPILRHALLEMGRRLAEAGVLREGEDVLHLRLEELEELPAAVSDADAERLRDTVRARAARRAELAGVAMIASATLFPDTGDDSEALVAGTPAGGGRATGVVRVIRESAEFGNLRAGDILVCPYTNPAWTPLFQSAAGVVVDTGGPASHAAIVAREYGIPAVMGTGTATSRLKDGQLVTVDGDHGRVTAVEGPAEADR